MTCRTDFGITEDSSQSQFHEESAFFRVIVVRVYCLKSERAIELDRLLHRRQSIQAHATVADPPRLFDNLQREGLACSRPTRGGAHIQSLHLAGLFVKPSQPDA